MSRTSTPGRTATDTGGAGAATGPDAPAAATPRRGPLRGLPWLVWRRHRALLLTALLLTVVGCATFAYQRAGVLDFLHTQGTPTDTESPLSTSFQSTFSTMFGSDTVLLQLLPFAAGIFLGAPLIAGEQEHGTAKLVLTQSVSRGRWLTAALGLPLAVVVLCATLLSAAFSWLWAPAHGLVMNGNWLESGPFDTTGPVPVAKTLFLTLCGIAIGMLFKRVVPAMAATTAFSLVAAVLWADLVRPRLGTLHSIKYPYGSGGRDLPFDAARVNDWMVTTYGRPTGVTEYFEYGQMAGMQWRGAGILLAASAVVLAFVVWRTHRRPL
ncbi:ABC transporter permease [Streptomyces sp. NPDC058773]|uniref:ABC transporter permease n=1 Tax=Streptomyces sp. NPDC058773 TaxID=3346632 RepID=UPI0036CED0FC